MLIYVYRRKVLLLHSISTKNTGINSNTKKGTLKLTKNIYILIGSVKTEKIPTLTRGLTLHCLTVSFNTVSVDNWLKRL